MTRRLPAVLAGAVLSCAFASRAHALGAAAGTTIDNTAQVSYSLAGAAATASSNTTSLQVAEILDLVVTLQTPTVAVQTGSTGQVMVFRVTNTGNGPESVRLTVTSALGGDDFDPQPAAPGVFLDTDGNGTLSAADAPYVPGSNDPALLADASVTVFVLHDIPGGLADGARGLARLTAAARTGTGAPGTVYAGSGVAGTDAVIGTSGADAAATGEYRIGGAQLTIVKSAAVTDSYGGTRPLPGARIEYRVVVTPAGAGVASGAVFVDPIPVTTTYVAGSLRLNDAALTDAGDADAGAYVVTPAPRVRVLLGDLTAASGPQTVAFTVTID